MKLSDQIEKKIEKLIDDRNTKQLTNPKLLGRVKRLEDGNEKYIEILKKNFPNNFHLRGIKIVLDCANGAGYKSAPKLLEKLGAKVISIGIKPNGLNINDKCGSTYPSKIQSVVKRFKAHIRGFIFTEKRKKSKRITQCLFTCAANTRKCNCKR